MPRWIVPTALVAAILVGATATTVALRRTGQPAPAPTAADTPEPSPTPSPAPGSGLADLLGGEVPGGACLLPEGDDLGALLDDRTPLPADPEALVATVATQVAALRELPLGEPVEAAFLPPDDAVERLLDVVLTDYTPQVAAVESRFLAALGVVDPGTDLLELRTDLLSGQVAGFYLPATGELVVKSAAELSAADRITLAHELVHAVTDQSFALPEERDPEHVDQELAEAAVIEGDASLVMNRWALTHLGVAEQLSLLGDPTLATAQQELEQAPVYLQQELLFPYTAGLDLVCTVHQAGGWAAVDALYDQPPTSTAQVLFPERLAAGEEPVAPRPPTPPAGDWERRLSTTFGAANLSWLFAAPGDEPGRALADPRLQAAGWAGGTATLWARSDATVVALAFTQRGGAPDLCAAIGAWYEAAFDDDVASGPATARDFEGAQQDAALRCGGGRVGLGIAPDLVTAGAVAR